VFLVDTNVLVYGADRDSEVHEPCRALLEEWMRFPTPWFLTWPICYEFIRVTTHPQAHRHPWSGTNAWEFLAALLASPGCSILLPTPRHPSLLGRTLAELPNLRGSMVHDLHTAVLMREHGVSRIYTRDTQFHRFPFLTVLDPLQ
jgi:toxin-antitoxin system PIN domain toxin